MGGGRNSNIESGRAGMEGEDGMMKEIYSVAFWNVAELGNKGMDFWREVRGWDIMVFCET